MSAGRTTPGARKRTHEETATPSDTQSLRDLFYQDRIPEPRNALLHPSEILKFNADRSAYRQWSHRMWQLLEIARYANVVGGKWKRPETGREQALWKAIDDMAFEMIMLNVEERLASAYRHEKPTSEDLWDWLRDSFEWAA